MLARNRRLAAAGLITAAAIAVPTAALAAGSGSPSAKPTPPASAARSAKPTPPESAAGPAKPGVKDRLPALAAAAGISVDRVQAGLVAMKRAGGNTPAGIAAFAAAAGVSNATAQRVVDAVFRTQDGPGSPSAKQAAAREFAARGGKSAMPDRLPALAAAAGISVDRVQGGLVAMKRAGGNTPAGIAAFAAAAGVSNATAQRVAGILSGGPTGHK